MVDLAGAVKIVSDFKGPDLKVRISALETQFTEASRRDTRRLSTQESIGVPLWEAALLLKDATRQIDVVIHAIGILALLPHVLEDGEIVKTLSLGAGSTGKKFDLETDRQVAEFKFIEWQGGAEAIRQNYLFKDFYNLAEHHTSKRRCLYVLGTEHPLKFLRGKRTITSVFSRNVKLLRQFRDQYEQRFQRVHEYYEYRKHRVEIKDAREFAGTPY